MHMMIMESGNLKSSDGPTQKKPTHDIVIAAMILTRFSIHLGIVLVKAAILA